VGGVTNTAGGATNPLTGVAGGVANTLGGGATNPLTGAVGGVTDALGAGATNPAAGATNPLTGVAGGATNPITGVTEPLTGAVGGLTGGATNPFIGAVGGATNPIGGVTEPLAGVVGGVTNPAGGITNPVGAVTNPAGGATNPSGVTNPLTGVVGGVTNPLTGAAGGAAGGATNPTGGATNPFTGAGGGETNPFTGAVGGVTNPAAGTTNPTGGATFPNAGFGTGTGVGGNTGGFPTIPGVPSVLPSTQPSGTVPYLNPITNAVVPGLFRSVSTGEVVASDSNGGLIPLNVDQATGLPTGPAFATPLGATTIPGLPAGSIPYVNPITQTAVPGLFADPTGAVSSLGQNGVLSPTTVDAATGLPQGLPAGSTPYVNPVTNAVVPGLFSDPVGTVSSILGGTSTPVTINPTTGLPPVTETPGGSNVPAGLPAGSAPYVNPLTQAAVPDLFADPAGNVFSVVGGVPTPVTINPATGLPQAGTTPANSGVPTGLPAGSGPYLNPVTNTLVPGLFSDPAGTVYSFEGGVPTPIAINPVTGFPSNNQNPAVVPPGGLPIGSIPYTNPVTNTVVPGLFSDPAGNVYSAVGAIPVPVTIDGTTGLPVAATTPATGAPAGLPTGSTPYTNPITNTVIPGLFSDPATGTVYSSGANGPVPVTINPATGLIPGLPAGSTPYTNPITNTVIPGLFSDPATGTVYSAEASGAATVAINPATGLISGLPASSTPYTNPITNSVVPGLFSDPTTGTVYSAGGGIPTPVTINQITGLPTAATTPAIGVPAGLPAGSVPYTNPLTSAVVPGLFSDPAGNVLSIAGGVPTPVTINPATGLPSATSAIPALPAGLPVGSTPYTNPITNAIVPGLFTDPATGTVYSAGANGAANGAATSVPVPVTINPATGLVSGLPAGSTPYTNPITNALVPGLFSDPAGNVLSIAGGVPTPITINPATGLPLATSALPAGLPAGSTPYTNPITNSVIPGLFSDPATGTVYSAGANGAATNVPVPVTINPATGLVSGLPAGSIPYTNPITSAVVPGLFSDPAGNVLSIAGGVPTPITINPATGLPSATSALPAGIPVGSTPYTNPITNSVIPGLFTDPATGTVYSPGANGAGAPVPVTIDPATGLISGLPAGSTPYTNPVTSALVPGLFSDPTGTVYTVGTTGTPTPVAINPTTGLPSAGQNPATNVPTGLPAGSIPYTNPITNSLVPGLFTDPATGTVYSPGANGAGAPVPVTIDPVTGLLSGLPTGSTPYTNPVTNTVVPGLFSDPTGAVYTVGANGTPAPITINPATGLPPAAQNPVTNLPAGLPTGSTPYTNPITNTVVPGLFSDPATGTVYSAGTVSAAAPVPVTIDRTTGLVSGLPTGSTPYTNPLTNTVIPGLFSDPAGAIYSVGPNGTPAPVTVNPATGLPSAVQNPATNVPAGFPVGSIPYTNPITNSVVPGLFSDPAAGTVYSVGPNGTPVPVTINAATGLPSAIQNPATNVPAGLPAGSVPYTNPVTNSVVPGLFSDPATGTIYSAGPNSAAAAPIPVTINPATGLLSGLPAGSVPYTNPITSAVVPGLFSDPTTGTVYSVGPNGTPAPVTVNPATGLPAPVQNPATNVPTALPAGSIPYTNPITNSVVPGLFSNPVTGTVYSTGANSAGAAAPIPVTINPATGLLSGLPAGSTPYTNPITNSVIPGLFSDPATGTVYSVGPNGTPAPITVNPATGLPAPVQNPATNVPTALPAGSTPYTNPVTNTVVPGLFSDPTGAVYSAGADGIPIPVPINTATGLPSGLPTGSTPYTNPVTNSVVPGLFSDPTGTVYTIGTNGTPTPVAITPETGLPSGSNQFPGGLNIPAGLPAGSIPYTNPVTNTVVPGLFSNPATGTVYSTTVNGASVPVTIDPVTGLLSGLPTGSAPYTNPVTNTPVPGLFSDPATGTVYTVGADGTPAPVAINPATGFPSATNQFPGGPNIPAGLPTGSTPYTNPVTNSVVPGLFSDPATGTVYSAGPSGTPVPITIDPVTGLLSGLPTGSTPYTNPVTNAVVPGLFTDPATGTVYTVGTNGTPTPVAINSTTGLPSAAQTIPSGLPAGSAPYTNPITNSVVPGLFSDPATGTVYSAGPSGIPVPVTIDPVTGLLSGLPTGSTPYTNPVTNAVIPGLFSDPATGTVYTAGPDGVPIPVAINPTTGEPSTAQTIPAGLPSGSTAYTNPVTNAVVPGLFSDPATGTVYSIGPNGTPTPVTINTATGLPSAGQTTTVPAGLPAGSTPYTNPVTNALVPGLFTDPATGTVYSVGPNGTPAAVTINPATGFPSAGQTIPGQTNVPAGLPAGSTPYTNPVTNALVPGLFTDPATGTVYSVSPNGTPVPVTINTATGLPSGLPAGSTPYTNPVTGTVVPGLFTNPATGTVYSVGPNGTPTAVAINPVTGFPSASQNVPAGFPAGSTPYTNPITNAVIPGLFTDPATGTVYSVGPNGTPTAVAINSTTGLPSGLPAGSTPYTNPVTGAAVPGLFTNPATGTVYSVGPNGTPAAVTINPATGFPSAGQTIPGQTNVPAGLPAGSTAYNNPVTGAVVPGLFINPTTGTVYSVGTDGVPVSVPIDQTTGLPSGLPTGSTPYTNPVTGAAVPGLFTNPATGTVYSVGTGGVPVSVPINPATGLPSAGQTNVPAGLPAGSIPYTNPITNAVVPGLFTDPVSGAVYTVGTDGSPISVPINQVTGLPSGLPTGSTPYTNPTSNSAVPGLFTDPATGTVYTLGPDGAAVSVPIDQTTGLPAGLPTGSTPYTNPISNSVVPGLFTDPATGTVYTLGPDGVPTPVTINQATGLASATGQTPATTVPAGLPTGSTPYTNPVTNAVVPGLFNDPAGVVYAVGATGTPVVVPIDTTTGLPNIPGLPSGSSPYENPVTNSIVPGLFISPTGEVYSVVNGAATPVAIDVDTGLPPGFQTPPTTTPVTNVPGLPTGSTPYQNPVTNSVVPGLFTSPTGEVYSVANGAATPVTIDATTGLPPGFQTAPAGTTPYVNPVTGATVPGLFVNGATGAVVSVGANGTPVTQLIDPRTGLPAIPYTNPVTGLTVPNLYTNPANNVVATIANGVATPVTINPTTGLPVSPPLSHAREMAMLANDLFYGNVSFSRLSTLEPRLNSAALRSSAALRNEQGKSDRTLWTGDTWTRPLCSIDIRTIPSIFLISESLTLPPNRCS
jgi:hypothetical protein